MKPTENAQEQKIVGILGLGLDNSDAHQRLTRSENFLLLGGSAETHERMQDSAIYFNESLQRKGKTLQETEPAEVLDLLREALDRQA